MNSGSPPSPEPQLERSLVRLAALAERSGLQESTLRSWSSEYGFPAVVLRSAGEAFFDVSDVLILRQVQRAREAGHPLPVALQAARASSRLGSQSLSVELRRERPDLAWHVLRKSALVAVSRAIEDEVAQAPQDAVIVGGFQHERHYRASERRWQDLAARARHTVVFADFAESRIDSPPITVAGAWRDPFIREWFVICCSPVLSVVLVACERPRLEDGARHFEATWSTDHSVLAVAMDVVRARLAELPDVDLQDAHAHGESAASERLMNRIVAYLSALIR